ncbi:RsmB/NOP family class I SAM-dependent RNA methyltransferase [Flexivirga caeni]|uniref:rRNA small subunit methyltransferase B n=1 Tax=Flexivirga caeni TaxID=2294115 RepID=A0A3M9LZW5_9MICO|nr:transcription antitermination factor NusB [Flexivirga caeni]RNI18163.1 rRNA small subunit methyltransferase B [Flexivirga caeni]
MNDEQQRGGYRDERGRQRPESRRAGGKNRTAVRPADRRRGGDPTRKAAWQVSRAVAGGAYANLELPKVLRAAGLHGRDAAFATELTYGAIRMRGLYDAIIEFASGRPVSQIDPPVLDTLRLGAHQILGMRVPPHAAASETVALAREVNGTGASGFVNAVLRRITERTREEWIREVTAGRPRDEALAVEHSHPAWVVRALRGSLRSGGVTDEAHLEDALVALLEADNAAPAVSLVARPGLATVAELVEAGAEASQLSPVGAVLPGGDPADIPAVRQTRAAVQDEGSQLVALALAAAPRDGDGPQEWLDLCAGPGGKAALLAALSTSQQNVTVFVNEVNEHRTELVRRTMRAAIDAGAEVMIGTGDGRELGAEEPDTYDRILVDAPCTGLGALRRRPEARWRRTPADVGELTAIQAELLASALDAAKPGGVVAYVTCSPHVAETTAVVDSVTEGRGDATVEDARGLFRDASGSQISDLGDGPTVQLWPHVHGTDAMFFALLRKTVTS